MNPNELFEIYDNYCGKKFNESYNGEKNLKNTAKYIFWGIAGGAPIGFCALGAEFLLLGMIGLVTGQRIGFVKK